MSSGMRPPGSVVVPDSFASGLAAHFDTYCRVRGVSSGILVRVILANNEPFIFEGLRVEHLADVPGCVMLHGVASAPGKGLVAREEHIFAVEFGVELEKAGKFGFD